ncbi:MAG: hypothetical protein WD534_00280 [Phycisphaeraceae bacterium]
MTVDRALRLAWIWWTVFLLTPAALFVIAMWWLVFAVGEEGAAEHRLLGDVFFIASCIWLLVVTPAAFLLRYHLFKSYYEGRPVDPASYLKGMLTIWLAPEIGGIIALLGVLLSGSLLPGLLPAAVAFMLFTPFWPSGQAMVARVGAEDDEQVFRRPR